jgi:hypothetical protein
MHAPPPRQSVAPLAAGMPIPSLHSRKICCAFVAASSADYRQSEEDGTLLRFQQMGFYRCRRTAAKREPRA